MLGSDFGVTNNSKNIGVCWYANIGSVLFCGFSHVNFLFFFSTKFCIVTLQEVIKEFFQIYSPCSLTHLALGSGAGYVL